MSLRSARSAWNYLSVLAFSAVSMATGLVVTPMLIRLLGDERLGATRALSDVVGYLVLLEMGLSGALAPLMAAALAKRDERGLSALVVVGRKAYARVLAYSSLAALGLCLVIRELIVVSPGTRRDLTTGAVAAAAPLLFLPLTPLRVAAEAAQRGHVINSFLIAQTVTVALTGVAFAAIGWGITGQMLALVAGASVFWGMVFADDRRGRRFASARVPLIELNSSGAELRRLNWPTFVANMCGRFGLLADNIMIGSILSASAVVPFVVTQRLAQVAQAQLQAIGSASWAGLTELKSQGQVEAFQQRFIELNQLVTMLGLAVLGPILIYNVRFVSVWVGGSYYIGDAVTLLSCLNALVVSIVSLWGWVFGGTGQVRKILPVVLASACVNVSVSIAMTLWFAESQPRIAACGPLLGTAIAFGLVNLPALPFLLRRHFGISIRRLLLSIVWPALVALPYFALVAVFVRREGPSTWGLLMLEMSGTSCGLAVVYWVLVLSRDQRASWRSRLRSAVPGLS